MTTIHTFHTLQGTKETRKSKTRQYAACLVATATEETFENRRNEIAATRAALTEHQAKLVAIETERGMTLAEATEAYEAERAKDWHGTLWAMQDTIREEMSLAKGSGDAYRAKAQIEAEAKKRLAEQGFLSPWRDGGPHDIVAAGSAVQLTQNQLDRLVNDLTKMSKHKGYQEIISWHLTLQNAQKSLRATGGSKAWSVVPPAEVYRQKGFKITIETTFEVRQTGRK